LFKLAGGRGIGAGEKSLKTDGGVKELFADPERDNVAESVADKRVENPAAGEEDIYVGQGRYMKGDSKKLPKKENLGFFIGATGGFAGGEENLWNFRDEVKSMKEAEKIAKLKNQTYAVLDLEKTALRPPLLMPGMNAFVKEPKNPYYQFTGIVQRVTDGKAMLIFEGGNWDKSITVRLEDLEPSKSGPPGENPKSAALADKIAELKAYEDAKGLVAEADA